MPLSGRVRSWSVAVAVIGVGALVARVPGLIHLWYGPDEPYIAVQAQTLMRGDRLYVDVIDRKPPLVPVVYAAIGRTLGLQDLRIVRGVLVLWLVATAVLIALLVVRLGGSRRAGVVAGLLFVLGTAVFAPQDAQAANFELWAVLPMVAAILVVVRPGGRPSRPAAFVAAGVLVGLAAYFKQPFVMTLIPVGLYAWRSDEPRRAVTAVGGGLVGALAALSAVFGVAEMTRWVWLENTEYTAGLRPSVALIAVGSLAAFAALHAPAVWLGVRGARPLRPTTALVVVWLVASLAGVAMGLRFRGHYYQQALPPLCVLAGLGSDAVGVWGRRVAVVTAAASTVIAAGVALSPIGAKEIRKLEPIVALTEQHTEPGDPVLVWGAAPEIAWRIDRPIAGRFVNDWYVMQLGWNDVDAGAPDHERLRERWDELLDDVRADPPILVIDTSPRGMDGFGPYHLEDSPLGPILRQSYTRIESVFGYGIWRYDGADPGG